MALPTDPAASREETLARRRAAEEDSLLREVDEAVRQDDLASFGQRYGRVLVIGTLAVLLAFGGYLFWNSRQEAAREAQSEALIAAIDQAQARNFPAAATAAQRLAGDSAAAPEASARLLEAGAMVAQNRSADAVKALNALAADSTAPAPLRDLARLRLVAMQFDTMDKTQIVTQLAPLAKPGSPWFGSAGELLAMAYLEQGKRAEAGKLFGEIARDASVPEGVRSRSRQMAGVLGVDAIPDANSFLRQQLERQQADDSAAAAPRPAA